MSSLRPPRSSARSTVKKRSPRTSATPISRRRDDTSRTPPLNGRRTAATAATVKARNPAVAPTSAPAATPSLPAVPAVPPKLTASQRQALKAQAHGAQPVAMIGSKGLTDAVVAEVELQLAQHGLVKVKAASDERAEREAWLGQLCERLAAAPVQHIGKVLLLFRPKAPEPVAEPPPKKVRPKDKPTPQERRMEAAGVSPNVGKARVGARKAPGFQTYDGRVARRDDSRRRAPPRPKPAPALDSTQERREREVGGEGSSVHRPSDAGESTRPSARGSGTGSGGQLRRRRPVTPKG